MCTVNSMAPPRVPRRNVLSLSLMVRRQTRAELDMLWPGYFCRRRPAGAGPTPTPVLTGPSATRSTGVKASTRWCLAGRTRSWSRCSLRTAHRPGSTVDRAVTERQ
jgi:hypothetical protein